jgi:hypothetical protein
MIGPIYSDDVSADKRFTTPIAPMEMRKQHSRQKQLDKEQGAAKRIALKLKNQFNKQVLSSVP